MEQDRYQKNHTLFIVGMFSMVVCLGLFAFSLYLLPNLLFGWRYDIPEFIGSWRAWFSFTYNVTETMGSMLVFLLLIGLTVVFFVMAYFSSNRVDNEIYSEELHQDQDIETVKVAKDTGEAVRLASKILLIVVAVFVVATLFEWLIASNG